jgi:hypothetical protein
MSLCCDGHCYDVVPLEARDVEETPLLSSYHEPTTPYVYSPLKPAQTRIIRLHPTRDPSEGSPRDNLLYTDLVTVNLHILEGAMIDGTTQSINYTALSYHWGHPELSETLFCDGRAKPISRQNAMALRALRHPTETVNLWIDALCINQDDKREKSEQVAHMLAIYKKAQWVTVWLGNSDSDSLLAFACVPKLPAMKAALAKHQTSEHHSSCNDQLMAISLAVLGLFGRPWLGRTWVRQEIYGARELIVQCGDNNISWQDFIGLDAMMRNIIKLQPDRDDSLRMPERKVRPLLQEARSNADVPLHGGAKPPRYLVEVLLQSRQFKFTDPRDTFYAVLGMCNIETRAGPSYGGRGDPRKVVSVDYQKPLYEVYNDASFYIINNQTSLNVFVALWHRYRRSPSHSEGLATWAVDWLSGVRSRSGLDRAVSIASWLPLGEAKHDDGRARERHLPPFLQEDRTVLRLEARVLNYVAHLTDYTCDDEGNIGSFALGTASMSVHVDGFADSPGAWFSEIPHRPVKFDRKIHKWRLAILGVADTSQLCLVPSSASKGDLVVAVAPGLPPMLISPRPGNSAAASFYEPRDPWEARSCDVAHTSRLGIPVKLFPDLWLINMSFLLVCPLVFTILFWAFRFDNTTLQPSLLPLTYTYACVYTRCILWDQRRPSELFDDIERWWIMLPSAGSFGCPFYTVLLIIFFWSGTRSLRLVALAGFYLAFALSTMAINQFWQHCALVHNAIPIAFRRERLCTLLDNVVKTTGRDYEFHGPLFLREPMNWQLIPGDREPRLMHFFNIWVPCWLFGFAVAVNNRTTGRPRVEKFMESRLFDRIVEGKYGRVRSRPVQQFRLH